MTGASDTQPAAPFDREAVREELHTTGLSWRVLDEDVLPILDRLLAESKERVRKAEADCTEYQKCIRAEQAARKVGHDALATVQADNARLREALEPFADAWDACQAIGDQGGGYVDDDQSAWVSGHRDGNRYILFRFGDLRRAREALSSADAKGGEPAPIPLSGKARVVPKDEFYCLIAEGWQGEWAEGVGYAIFPEMGRKPTNPRPVVPEELVRLKAKLDELGTCTKVYRSPEYLLFATGSMEFVCSLIGGDK